MIKKYLEDDFVLVPVAFGLGLILSGRLLFGVIAALIGVAAAFRDRFREKGALASVQGSAKSAAASGQRSGEPEQVPAASARATLDGWYYERNGEAAGPLKETELLALFQSGKIGRETAVFNAALGEQWLVFSQTHLAGGARVQPSVAEKTHFGKAHRPEKGCGA